LYSPMLMSVIGWTTRSPCSRHQRKSSALRVGTRKPGPTSNPCAEKKGHHPSMLPLPPCGASTIDTSTATPTAKRVFLMGAPICFVWGPQAGRQIEFSWGRGVLSYTIRSTRYKQNRPSRDIGGHDRTMEEISEFVLTSVLTLPFLKP
jgi:hypothetical protein